MLQKNILIVEDEGLVAIELQQTLEKFGYFVTGITSNGKDAIKLAVEKKPDLILMDIRLKGDMDGVEAAGQIKLLTDIPIIYLTAHSDSNSLDRAKTTDPAGYILKPFDERSLKTTIEITLYKASKTNKLEASDKWFSSILNSIGDAIVIYDQSNCITFMNNVCEKLVKISREAAIGKEVRDVLKIVVGKTRKEMTLPPLDEIVEKQSIVLEDHILLLSGSRELLVDLSISPIKIESENTIGTILVIKDMTERKKLGKTIQLELDASVEMQRRLLPAKESTLGGIRVNWFLQPCSFGAGDLFDFFKINEQYVGFYIFDVMGHGISATVTSLMLHRLLSPYPDEGGLVKQFNDQPSPPPKVLTELNKQYYFKRPFQFFTIVYGIIDTATGQSRLVRAGHEFPIYISKGGKVEQIRSEGAAIGFLPELSLEEYEFTFDKGDRMFLYSDGLIECVNAQSEPFTINRLLFFINEQKNESLKTIVESLEQKVFEWRGKSQLDDDISLMALERNEN